MALEKKTGTLSSVTNAMKILRLFTPKQTEMSVREIARQSNLPKSSAHRLILLLAKKGFLSKNPRTNHYRLGLSFLTLGGVIFSHRELFKEAQPIVHHLAQAINETVHICLMEDQHVVYLFRVESQHPDRLLTQMGRKNPLHCTSEGLCILAFQTEKVVDDMLAGELYRYTPYTESNQIKLKSMLAEIRKQGYCLLSDSYYENYTGIAAPIRDHTGVVIASLSVIGRSNRIINDKINGFIKEIINAADEISEQLGYFKV